jgi:hypothetical protein
MAPLKGALFVNACAIGSATHQGASSNEGMLRSAKCRIFLDSQMTLDKIKPRHNVVDPILRRGEQVGYVVSQYGATQQTVYYPSAPG